MICTDSVCVCVFQPNNAPRLSVITTPQNGRMGMCSAPPVIKLHFLLLTVRRACQILALAVSVLLISLVS